MKIRTLDIDGYGRFHDHRIENLAPGLTVFLGQNEAGKSTLLAFIRAILFGFPDGRQSENKYAPLSQAQHGGRITLLDESGTEYIVQRHAGKKGGKVRVFSSDGDGDDAMLQRLLGSAGRGLFRNVFAFSLSELQQFETLDDQEVTAALYSAGLGTSAAKLSKVGKDLASRAEALFKPGGSKPEINGILRQLEDIRAKKGQLQNQPQEYDALVQRIDLLKSEAQDLREAEQAAARAGMEAARLIEAWPVWSQWIAVKETLDSLPTQRPITPDCVARLTGHRDRLAEYQGRAELKQRNLNEEAGRLEKLILYPALVRQGESIRRLAGHRTEWDRLRNSIPGHRRQEVELNGQLQQRLIQIHPDWDLERLQACNISVGRRDAIRRHQTALSEAERKIQRERDLLTESKRELSNALQHRDEVQKELDSSTAPDPGIRALQDDQLSDLRGQWRQTEDQARRAQQAYREAAGVSEEGLARLGQGWTSTQVQASHPSQDTLQQVRIHRQTMAEGQEAQAIAEREFQALEKQLATLTYEQEALRKTEPGPSGRTAEQIDAGRERLFTARADLLRRAGLAAALEQARASAESSAETMEPVPSWLIATIALSGIFLAAVLAYNEQTKLALAAVLFMFALAAGLHTWRARAATTSETRGHRQEEVRRRLSEVETDLSKADQDLQASASFFNVAPPLSSEMLDRLDRDLTKETATSERRRSFDQQANQFAERVQRVQQESLDAQQTLESAVLTHNKAKESWKDWLASHGLPEDLNPDSARDLLNDIQRLAECQRREERLREIADEARTQAQVRRQVLEETLLNVGRQLEAANLDNQITNLIADIKADAAKATRQVELQKRLVEANDRVVRIEKQGQEFEESLQKCQEAKHAAETSWLATRGDLPAETPEAALEVLQRAETARSLLDQAQRESAKREEAERATASLFEDACRVIHEAGRPAPLQDELTSSLDRLVTDLQQAESAEEERTRLIRQRESDPEPLEAMKSSIEALEVEVQKMYDQAGVSDETSFRQAADTERTRLEFQNAKQSHEQTLKQIAGGADFETFIQHLEDSDTDSLQLALERSREEKEILGQQVGEKQIEQGRAESERDTLQVSGELPRLRLIEESLKEQLRVLAQDWATVTLATHLLEQARNSFERERQPDVLLRASEHFSQMTGGRYTRLLAPPGDSKVVMELANGSRRETHELSTGTAEQAYLALRLGFVHEFSQRSEPLPLVMDDIFVNFDPQRSKAAMREVLKLTDRHQVLLFTCHPETVERVLEVDPTASVRELSPSLVGV